MSDNKGLEDIINERFYHDFPFDGIMKTIEIKEIEDNEFEQCKETSSEEILEYIKKYIDFQESFSQDRKLKYKGALLPTNKIKEMYNIKDKVKENIKKNKQENKEIGKKEEIIVPKIWFAEYNIKIGTLKYRKGTKIEGADNEVEARRNLDVYIKKNFSKVRSVTKVSLKDWSGEEDYSTPIQEILSSVITTHLPVKRTVEEIIDESFSENELNSQFILLVLKAKKIKPKDFEENFIVLEDDNKSEEEIFQTLKNNFPFLKRKNVAIKKANLKQILNTKKFRNILQSQKFEDLTLKGMAGVEAIKEISGEELNIKNFTEEKSFSSILEKISTKGKENKKFYKEAYYG